MVQLRLTLVVFGILLLLVGLVGKVKAKELEVGTSNTAARVIIGIVGGVLLVLSFFPDVPMQYLTKLGLATEGAGGSEGAQTTPPTSHWSDELDALPTAVRIKTRKQAFEIFRNPSLDERPLGKVRTSQGDARITVVEKQEQENGPPWLKAQAIEGWMSVQDPEQQKSTPQGANVTPYPCEGECTIVKIDLGEDCLWVRESPNRPFEADDNALLELCSGIEVSFLAEPKPKIARGRTWRYIALEAFWFRPSLEDKVTTR